MASKSNFHNEAEALHKNAAITRRMVYDNLIGTEDTKPKVEGLKVSSKEFVTEVMGEVASLNGVARSELNTESLQKLHKEAENFTKYIRARYKDSKISGSAKTFRKKYGESWLAVDFDWIPDLNPTEELIPVDSVLEEKVHDPDVKQKRLFTKVPTNHKAKSKKLKFRKAWDKLTKRGKNKRINRAVQLCTKPVIRAAARQELVEKSGTYAGEVYDALLDDPKLGRKLRNTMRSEPERTQANPVESLAYYLDKDMSRKDWRDHVAFCGRFTGCGKMPSYEDLKKEMEDILPDDIEINDFEAKVPLKNLLEKSVSRYFQDKENLEMLHRKKEEKQMKATDGCGSKVNLKVSYKWGLDGTSPGNQYHQEGEEDKHNIMATQMVILQLEDADTGEIYWRNPLANSCSSCR